MNRSILDCGGKRSATPLSAGTRAAKALSPLRSASAVQKLVGLKIFVALSMIMSGFGTVSAAQSVSDLKSDETILFYPTLAAPAKDGGWDIRVHGCVYELERRRFTLAALHTALRLDGIKMDESDLANFRARGRLFLADNERNHRVIARIGETNFDVGKSAPNGHFEKLVHLDALADTNSAILKISAVLSPADTRQFSGVALVMPVTGVSVVSDIDDTIKISEVLDRSALVRRTFLQPFEAVPGMVDVYKSWAANGAQFHYVSASPWQLHLPLLEFTRTNGFVQGSWHMRQWRLKDRSFKSVFEKPDNYKVKTITPLLREFPQRRFVLVGDSGERDPEAYATLARKFPKQVAAIFIRDVTGQGPDAERYRTNFAGLPEGMWRVFKEPSEIASLLPK